MRNQRSVKFPFYDRGALMYERPSVVALRDSLVIVARTRPGTAPKIGQDALREHLCAAVDELKAAGWMPERVIIAVKQIAEDAGLRPSRALLHNGVALSERDMTIMAIVRWCIERYYHNLPSDEATALER
jgi:hypothetical protein